MRLSLHAELGTDYFEAHSLDAQKRLLDDTVVVYQRALQLTKNRFEGGVASKAEVAQAQTQLNTTEAQDIDVTAARAQFEHAIAVLVGKPPEEFKLLVKPLRQTLDILRRRMDASILLIKVLGADGMRPSCPKVRELVS